MGNATSVRQKVDRLKINPQMGRMPVLQILPPAELEIDRSYQRSIEAPDSQNLIKRVAQHWNWDLCQPLVISRRRDPEGGGDRFFVIDGQHRLEAARLRGDINQLPCVVLEFSNAADEAASFVQLNQLRRPLTKLQLFSAAVAAGDKEACAISEAITQAGLSIASHTCTTSWKPGMVGNVSGIETAWRRRGARSTTAALRALATAFSGQLLRYAGTIFPGIAAVCHDEFNRDNRFADARFDKFVTMLALRSQDDWKNLVAAAKADNPDYNYGAAAEAAIRQAWKVSSAEPTPMRTSAAPAPVNVGFTPPAPSGPRWCEQCEKRVSDQQASACGSRFCKLKDAA